MDLQDWKWTIINWIACVSSSNIRDISDLENGEVFSNLIRELRKDKTSNVKKAKTPLRYVKKFLRDEYPAFKLFDSTDLFNHEEALFVGSILLHYCCVVCKGSNLEHQQKMSENLEGPYQVNIVKYLENMMQKDSITRDAIASSVPLTDTHSSPSATSVSPTTPGQDKYAAQLHRLKEQLKNSQSEIYYLEESVKSYTERCDQLVLERDKLLAESKSLRSELALLDSENKTPNTISEKPAVDPQLVELQKEIIAKNKLIEQFQNDIEVLQTEKQELEDKMRSMNKDLQLLEENALKLEYKNDSLQRALADKDLENQHLSEICNEQCITIEQLKEVRQIDQSIDSIDLSMSQLPPEVQSRYTECENLAHSVVDVQLREREEEVRVLQNSLDKTKTELNKISKDNGDLLAEKEMFKSENQKQKEEQEHLKAEFERNTESMKIKTEIMEKALQEINLELKNSIEKIEELEKLNNVTNDRMSSAEATLAEKIQSLLSIIGQDLDSIPVLTIDNSLTLLTNIIAKVESTKCLNDQLNTDVVVLKTQLENESERFIQMQEQKARCEADRNNIALELTISKKQVEEIIELNEQFQTKIVQLTHFQNENEVLLQELNKIKQEYQQGQSRNEKIELEIQDLNDIISDKNIVIANLESAKLIMIEKCNENNLQLTKLTALLNDNSAEIKQLLEVKQELSESHSKLQNEFKVLKRAYDSKVNDFNLLQESTNKEIQQLTSVVTQLNNENIKFMTEKCKLIELHNLEKQEIREEILLSQQKILELKATNSKLESNLEVLCKNNQNYENTIQNLQKANDKSTDIFNEFKRTSETNIQEYVRQTEILSKDVQELNNKVQVYEIKISELTSNISVLTSKLEKYESEKEKVVLDIQKHSEISLSLEKQLNESVAESKVLSGRLKKTEAKLEEAQQEQASVIESWQRKVQEKDDQILQLEQSIDSFEDTISNLNSEIDKLEEEILNKNNINENISKQICDVKSNKNEIEETVITLLNKCAQNEKLIEGLQTDKDVLINEHSKYMYEKEQEIDVYLKDIGELKNRLSDEKRLTKDLTAQISQNNELISKLEQYNSDLSQKVERLTSIISLKDGNVQELKQNYGHCSEQLNSANIQIEELSSKTALLNTELIKTTDELTSKLSNCKNLVKEKNLIEIKNNELSAELTSTLQELKNIRKSYEDKIAEHHELLQKTKANLSLCEEQYAKDNKDMHKKYKELQIKNENSTKEFKSQIVNLTKEFEIEKVKRLESEELLKNEKCEAAKLSALISTFEHDRCLIRENCDKFHSTILAIIGILKTMEEQADVALKCGSNTVTSTSATANPFLSNMSQIDKDLKSIQKHLSSFVESYRLLQNIAQEKNALEEKYHSLKLESENMISEHNQHMNKVELRNKVLNLNCQHLKDFVQDVKELCRDNSETENLVQAAFCELQDKLDKTEKLKIENLRSTKQEFRAQIDKLVELKNNAKTDFNELADLNCSLHRKFKVVNGRRSIKYNDALSKKEELEKHFNRLNSHNITLIEKIISQLLSFMGESEDIAHVDITDIVNTIQYILNDARIVKEQYLELDNSVKDFIEDTSSSHDTDYSNDLIEVYTPVSSTPSGYVGRQVNKTTIHNHFDINSKYESLKSDYDNLSTSHDLISKELSDLKIKFNNVQKELQEVSNMQKHQDIINENLKLQKQISGLFNQVEDQSNELIAARKLNEDLKKEVEMIDKKYSLAKIKYVEYDEMKSKLIENLKKQLADSSDIDDKVEQKVKEVRNEYEGKLEKMKNKMKELYNNEMSKLDKKVQAEKACLEDLCTKYSAKIKSYEAHVANLSKELFEMGEKYVAEQNENAALKTELRKIQLQSARRESFANAADLTENEKLRRATFPRNYKGVKNTEPGFVDVIEETITTTKRCVKPLSSVGSNIYMEDEDEVFNNTYLMDLKAGRCEVPSRRASVRSCENLSTSNDDSGAKRLSELKWRNSLCPPHLRSSYATETQLEEFKESDVRVLDTSSAQLLPSDFGKTGSSRLPKDRGAGTSYRKPGPPTPSKNAGRNSIGGRNSLINNELPRDVLKERNDNKSSGAIKKAKATTPNRIKAMFMGSKNGPGVDENESSSPKKRLSLFKRPRS